MRPPQQMEKLGAAPVDVSLPRTEGLLHCPGRGEPTSALRRRRKFSHRAAQYTDLLDMAEDATRRGLWPEVKRRIMIGTYVSRIGYYDAYYLQAQKLRAHDRGRLPVF